MPRFSFSRLALALLLCIVARESVGIAQDEQAIAPLIQNPSAFDDPARNAVAWSVQADAIFLRRTSSEPQPLVDGDTPYSVSDLDLPFRFGPRLSATRHHLLGTMWDAEVIYFGIDGGWSTQASSANATQFFTEPIINFGPRNVTTQYSSSLHSTELNLRRPLGNRLTFLTGFRWMEMDDNLLTDLDGSSHEVDVNNHLYGYQLGADVRFFSIRRLDVAGWLKAGTYWHVADQTTTMVNIGGAAPAFAARGEDVAFAGEVCLTGTWWFNNWLAARVGYQVLWLDSMALAPSQLPASDIVTGVATLDMDNTLFYHGGLLGLEATW